MPTNGPKPLSEILGAAADEPISAESIERMVAELKAKQARQMAEEGRTEPRVPKPVQPTLRAKEEPEVSKKSAAPYKRESTSNTQLILPSPLQAPTERTSVVVEPGDKHQRRPLNLLEELTFPWCPDDFRAASNDLLRTALFTVGQSKKRLQFKGQHIASLGSLDVSYTGEELRQKDASVFFQILHFGRGRTLDDPIIFTGADMLNGLKLSNSGRNYKELRGSLERMQASALHLLVREKTVTRGYSGGLIDNFLYEKENATRAVVYAVKMDPQILTLFSFSNYTWINWEQRLSLSPTAQWLHAFYSTHKDPFALTVSTLRDLTGSRAKTLARFRDTIRKAYDELKSVGFLVDWGLIEARDVIDVKRAPKTKELPDNDD